MKLNLGKNMLLAIAGGAALATVIASGCGKKDDKKAAPPTTTTTDSDTSLWGQACSEADGGYVCRHADVAKFFADDFETLMDTYTFTTSGSGSTTSDWAVTNGSGTDVTDTGITLTQGKPVKFILKGLDTAAHYLGEPLLFFNSALFKVDAKDTFSFTGPYVNAIENRTISSDSGAAGYELAVYFIPMVKGTYNAYCQIGVTSGSDYRMIRSGAVKPLLTTGHATTSSSTFGNGGMKLVITVEGEKDVVMSAPHATVAEANQRAYLDNHPWSDNGSYALTTGPNQNTAVSGQHLWNNASTGTATLFTYATGSQCTSNGQLSITVQSNNGSTSQTGVNLTGYCKFLEANGETFTQYDNYAGSSSAVAVTAAAPVKLRTGHAHIFRFKNAGTTDMTVEMEKLARAFTIRKIQTKNSENKVDFISTLTVKAGQWAEIFGVPMVKGDYTITTSNGTAVPVSIVDTL